MQDWNYFYTNDLELTVEQGCIKYPRSANIKSYWDANKYAYLTYIAEVSALYCGQLRTISYSNMSLGFR